MLKNLKKNLQYASNKSKVGIIVSLVFFLLFFIIMIICVIKFNLAEQEKQKEADELTVEEYYLIKDCYEFTLSFSSTQSIEEKFPELYNLLGGDSQSFYVYGFVSDKLSNFNICKAMDNYEYPLMATYYGNNESLYSELNIYLQSRNISRDEISQIKTNLDSCSYYTVSTGKSDYLSQLKKNIKVIGIYENVKPGFLTKDTTGFFNQLFTNYKKEATISIDVKDNVQNMKMTIESSEFKLVLELNACAEFHKDMNFGYCPSLSEVNQEINNVLMNEEIEEKKDVVEETIPHNNIEEETTSMIE